MSIQQALASASRDVLSSYLAPDLVEQLTEDIVQRAAADIELALVALAGFELPRTGGARAKQAATNTRPRAATRATRRRRDAAEGHDDAGSGPEHGAGAGPNLHQDEDGAEADSDAGENGPAAAGPLDADDLGAAAMA